MQALAFTDNRINNLLHQFPFSLPYGGYVNRTTGGWGSRSTVGRFWSEGAYSGSVARSLNFYGAYVSPENNYYGYKTNGFPVRCVASQNTQTDNRINNLLHQFPFSLPYGGDVARTTGGWNHRSTDGNFWSEGDDSGSYARYLHFYGARVNPEVNAYKTTGFPVRCVASQVSKRKKHNFPIRYVTRRPTKQTEQDENHSQGSQTDNRINNLLHQFPFSLPYGGNVYRTTGGWRGRSTDGFFWSEGADSGSYARYLGFYGANVYPESSFYKTPGLTVRCVAEKLRSKPHLKLHPNHI